MYRVIKEFHFDAGHRVWNHDMAGGTACILYLDRESELAKARTKCANLHGHTFFVEVHIESKTIDSQGMVVDTDIVSSVVKEIVSELDHSLILHKEDPIAGELLKIFRDGIFLIEHMPTAEGLARFFYEEIKRLMGTALPETVRISQVVVRISTSVRGVYYENEEVRFSDRTNYDT